MRNCSGVTSPTKIDPEFLIRGLTKSKRLLALFADLPVVGRFQMSLMYKTPPISEASLSKVVALVSHSPKYLVPDIMSAVDSSKIEPDVSSAKSA